MPRTVESEVFKFEELSEGAKECARAWWRECDACDNFWSESVIEDAMECAKIIGIDLRQRPVKLMGGGTRGEPAIYYSGFASQGDGACFEGTYSYAKGAAKAIRQHAPQDTVLHGIADALQAIQRRAFYRLNGCVKQSGHYMHSGCTRIEVTDDITGNDVAESVRQDIADALREFMDWIYHQLKSQWDYHNSDEQVDENILCNEYKFDESGRIA
jgi:hypothetical protein